MANRARRRKIKLKSAKIDRRFEVLGQLLECEKIYRRRKRRNVAETDQGHEDSSEGVYFIEEEDTFDYETEFKLVQMNFMNGRQSLYDLDADVEVGLFLRANFVRSKGGTLSSQRSIRHRITHRIWKFCGSSSRI